MVSWSKLYLCTVTKIHLHFPWISYFIFLEENIVLFSLLHLFDSYQTSYFTDEDIENKMNI